MATENKQKKVSLQHMFHEDSDPTSSLPKFATCENLPTSSPPQECLKSEPRETKHIFTTNCPKF